MKTLYFLVLVLITMPAYSVTKYVTCLPTELKGPFAETLRIHSTGKIEVRCGGIDLSLGPQHTNYYSSEGTARIFAAFLYAKSNNVRLNVAYDSEGNIIGWVYFPD